MIPENWVGTGPVLGIKRRIDMKSPFSLARHMPPERKRGAALKFYALMAIIFGIVAYGAITKTVGNSHFMSPDQTYTPARASLAHPACIGYFC